MTLQSKRAAGIIHSQRMASITPILIGCNDYLAYRTIFTRAMFHPKIKLDVFFPARKAVDELWAGGGGPDTPLMPVLTIDRTVFFSLFFLADLSYVGFVLVSDFWDISDRKQISLFVSKNKSSPMDLFLS